MDILTISFPPNHLHGYLSFVSLFNHCLKVFRVQIFHLFGLIYAFLFYFILFFALACSQTQNTQIEPRLQQWKCYILTTRPPRNSPHWFNLFLSILFFLMQLWIIGSLNFFSSNSLLVNGNATNFCVLILYPATLPNLFINSNVFWWSLEGFLYIIPCHLQVMTVLFLPFQFRCLLFLFLSYCSGWDFQYYDE